MGTETETTLPAVNSLWQHYNGNTYIVVGYSNKKSTPEHPLNILHRNIFNGELFSREASDWPRSFQALPREKFIHYHTTERRFYIDIKGIFTGSVEPLTVGHENAWRIAEEVMVDQIKENISLRMSERGESGL